MRTAVGFLGLQYSSEGHTLGTLDLKIERSLYRNSNEHYRFLEEKTFSSGLHARIFHDLLPRSCEASWLNYYHAQQH